MIRNELFDDTVREFIDFRMVGFDFSLELFNFGVEMI